MQNFPRLWLMVSILLMVSGCSAPRLVEDAEYTLSKRLYDDHQQYREPSISHRRFKHADIQPLIEKVRGHPDFRVQRLGASLEGRDISLISYGNGPVDVLMWSQMHGDEPTATMAIMDMFNFFTSEGYEDYKNLIKKELTLHFVPMLNPDGAERYQRRNANDVDLNRDALRLENPESQILKRVRDSLDADWGFNLHDQNRYYAAGINPHIASISFLAPAFNYPKEINQGRGDAMRLIGKMNAVLQQYIPNQVGKYNDAFEPRAFGDNIQKWGTNTILIESGGIKGDREKQELRRCNYVVLLTAFQAIANGTYKKLALKHYDAIPFNDSNSFHELLIRKARVKREDRKTYTLDIAFRQREVDNPDHSDFYLVGSIADVGDLSIAFGYEEFDAEAYDLEFGKVFPDTIRSVRDIQALDADKMLRDGFTDLITTTDLELWKLKEIPFRFRKKAEKEDVFIGDNPSLVFSKDGQVRYAVINGNLIKVQ